MMFRTTATLLGCLSLLGCSRVIAPAWTPPPLDTEVSQARSPAEDIRLLTEMFADQETNIWGEGTREIRWIETDVFRIFQCEEHYVLVYPANWTPERYSLMIVPGTVPELPAKVHALQQNDIRASVSRGDMAWAAAEELTRQKAGLGQFYLGMPREELFKICDEDSAIESFQDPSSSMVELGYPRHDAETISWTYRDEGNSLVGGRDEIRCEATLLNGRLAQLYFNRSDAPTLKRQRLSVHLAHQVSEGTVELSNSINPSGLE